MLIATTNELAGYEITDVLGEVFGLPVRSCNIGSQAVLFPVTPSSRK